MFEQNPDTACSGCKFNLGYRHEDQAPDLPLFAGWIDYLLRSYIVMEAFPPNESTLTAEEVSSFLILRNEMQKAQQVVIELKQKELEKKQNARKNRKD